VATYNKSKTDCTVNAALVVANNREVFKSDNFDKDRGKQVKMYKRKNAIYGKRGTRMHQ